MKMGTIFLAVSVGLVGAVPAAAQHYILDYYGFSQEEGGVLSAVGFVDQIMAPLTFDMVGNQYTYSWSGINVDSVQPMGMYVLTIYVGGSFRMYEDASFNAWYDDSNCPSSTLISDPSTFMDGDLYLEAVVDTIVHQFNTFTGVGSFTGYMSYVGGSHLGELPPDDREGSMFGGTTNNPLGCIPDGYDLRWDGQAFYIEGPSATDRNSWSSLKSLFR